MSSGLRPRQGHHKENGCRTVIEQAFAFNEEAQRTLNLLSLNMAMFATGSVAAISTLNTSAEGAGQSNSQTIPSVTTHAAITVSVVFRPRLFRACF